MLNQQNNAHYNCHTEQANEQEFYRFVLHDSFYQSYTWALSFAVTFISVFNAFCAFSGICFVMATIQCFLNFRFNFVPSLHYYLTGAWTSIP